MERRLMRFDPVCRCAADSRAPDCPLQISVWSLPTQLSGANCHSARDVLTDEVINLAQWRSVVPDKEYRCATVLQAQIGVAVTNAPPLVEDDGPGIPPRKL
jgi:hypothetical protein